MAPERRLLGAEVIARRSANTPCAIGFPTRAEACEDSSNGMAVIGFLRPAQRTNCANGRAIIAVAHALRRPANGRSKSGRYQTSLIDGPPHQRIGRRSNTLLWIIVCSTTSAVRDRGESTALTQINHVENATP